MDTLAVSFIVISIILSIIHALTVKGYEKRLKDKDYVIQQMQREMIDILNFLSEK